MQSYTRIVSKRPLVYYFGAYSDVGHALYERPGVIGSPVLRGSLPWSLADLDTGLCSGGHKGRQVGGHSAIRYKSDRFGNVWTALAIWDKSIDRRENSNSVFLSQGTFTFEQMRELSRQQWAQRFERIDSWYHLKLVEQDEMPEVSEDSLRRLG